MYRARYRRIVLFFFQVLLRHLYWDLFLPKIGFSSLSQRTRSKRLQQTARSFRQLAVQMGGVLIKVGQFLSSRADILPKEVTDELKGLQDEVPPAPFSEIKKIIEAEFNCPISDQFSAFDQVPIAAASLGQVHRARLKNVARRSTTDKSPYSSPQKWQSNVVIKVQRPHIDQIIEVDLSAIRTVGSWLMRYRPVRKRANIPALLDEFTKILNEEIDYVNEGRNAEIFATNFKDDPRVRVPRVVWSHTTRRALTLENVMAIKITDYDAIGAAGIERSEVASRLLDVYLKQIFEDYFFHADPHPGNLFVRPLTKKISGQPVKWELTFVDFGMTGSVPANLRTGLREALIGIGTRDSSRVVKAYQMMNILLPGADIAQIERAEAMAFERYWGKDMSELSSISHDEIKEFTDEFRDLIYNMPFQVPQNIIFLARCVGILSGMCTGLDPQFNVWSHFAPYAKKLISEDGRSNWQTVQTEIEKLTRTLLAMPVLYNSVLTRFERGEISVRTPEITQQADRLESALNQLTGGLIFALLTLGAILLYIHGENILSGISIFMGSFALIWVFLRNRSRKRP